MQTEVLSLLMLIGGCQYSPGCHSTCVWGGAADGVWGLADMNCIEGSCGLLLQRIEKLLLLCWGLLVLIGGLWGRQPTLLGCLLM